MPRRRLDTELVQRGLAGSLTEAQEAVRAGLVNVAGRPASKPSTMVDPADLVVLAGPPRRFVSRGGDKLTAALDRFSLDVAGLDCLDAGASSGGFTDCLLSRGAARVAAVDVGYGQLAWSLRTDPRVTVLERTNVRDLDPSTMPFRPTLVAADLSFVSLRSVLPRLAGLAAPDGVFVVLVKPQFEARPSDVVTGGVVRDPRVWRRVLEEVTRAGRHAGLCIAGVMASPLLGPAGNVEFFLLARASRAGDGVEVDLEAVVAEGLALREGP
jgi:23S rRNA (cytidine1920-2'-O)/16S rRNA (cytidine1409-2'-O)-methyltransferase